MFFKKHKKSQELDKILENIQMNMSNNYKDAAQEDFKKFETMLKEMKVPDDLSEKQKSYYENQLAMFKSKLENYTHKDQKVTW